MHHGGKSSSLENGMLLPRVKYIIDSLSVSRFYRLNSKNVMHETLVSGVRYVFALNSNGKSHRKPKPSVSQPCNLHVRTARVCECLLLSSSRSPITCCRLQGLVYSCT